MRGQASNNNTNLTSYQRQILRMIADGKKDHEILAYLHRQLPATFIRDSHPDLTPRQFEVIRYLVQGYTQREIAVRMGITVRTVRMHIGDAYQRLGIESAPQAVLWAVREGIIT